LDFADAALVFNGNIITFVDDRSDYGEKRYVTLGELEHRVVVVVHNINTTHTIIKRVQ